MSGEKYKNDIDEYVARLNKKPRNYTRKELAAIVASRKQQIRKENNHGKVVFDDWTVFLYPEKRIFELRIPFQVIYGSNPHDFRNCIYCMNI